MKIQLSVFFMFICLHSAFAHNNEKIVCKVLDEWHLSAAKTDFAAYFSMMHDYSVYIGTDATERWDKKSFMAYAKPYFDRGKAWTFKSIQRFVNFSADGKTAWVDELLDTQMKICRGSAILVLENEKWLIKHYVLSMTIPNDLVSTIVPLKASEEDKVIKSVLENK